VTTQRSQRSRPEGASTHSARAHPDGRQARWADHRVARRQELVAATVAVVRSAGAGVSMDDIAAISGIAKPVYYRYFADKADLHLAVGVAVAQNLVRQVTAAIDQEAAPRLMLAAAIDTYLRSIEADPELYRFVVHTAPPSRSPAPALADDYATVVGQHATRVISVLLARAGADTAPAEPWGFGLVGMVRAAADRWLDHPAMTREQLVDYLTDLVVPGFLRMVPDAG
jgi:AcrR family transcriptional regulator